MAAKAVNSHFDDFVSCYDKYKTDFVKAISTYPQYADDIIKYVSNDKEVALEIIDKYGETGIEIANISSKKMLEILAMDKGKRPDVSTYLSSDYIAEHLSMFDDGVTVIQTDYAYKTYSLDSGIVGVQRDNTLFVIPKSFCDDIIKKQMVIFHILKKH